MPVAGLDYTAYNTELEGGISFSDSYDTEVVIGRFDREMAGVINKKSASKLSPVLKNNHKNIMIYSLIQCSSVAQLCLTLCDPVDCRMPGFPVPHQLLELTQAHVTSIHDQWKNHP